MIGLNRQVKFFMKLPSQHDEAGQRSIRLEGYRGLSHFFR